MNAQTEKERIDCAAAIETVMRYISFEINSDRLVSKLSTKDLIRLHGDLNVLRNEVMKDEFGIPL